MNSIKQRLLMIFVVITLSLIANVSSRAASISGTINPTYWDDPTYSWTKANFGIIADTSNIVDAQSQSITISGTIGTLPENSDYWLEIGLVPKSVYDSPDYGFLPYIFNKGVLAYTGYLGADFEAGLLKEQEDPDAINVFPVGNDGSISFLFTLTPSGSAGGSGTMIVDGTTATFGFVTTLVYPQDLTESYLVGMVWVDSGNLDSVTISAEVVPPQDLSYTVAPSDLADGPTFLNGQGGVPFGYDPDSVKPEGVFLAGPAGFGDSCFWADVQGSAAGGGVDYTAIRLSPKDIFGVSDVRISGLLEISYYTKWVSDLDWQLKIYTEDDTATKWYGYRFNFTRPTFGDNNWNQSSTDTNLTVADIYDKVASGYVAVPVDDSLSGLDLLYGTQKILFIDIISSYMTDSPPGDSYLDGVRIELTNGDNATLDLAATPTTVWVDDDYCDGCANDGHTWGYDAFDNIQDGIDAVEGSTVNVAAGTYSDPIMIDKSLSIIGAGASLVSSTGGVVISGSFDGLTLDGLTLSGDGPGPKNAVIDSRNTTGPVSNITVKNCVLDGENSGANAFYGHYITGTWTFDNNEIKNFSNWYVIDNTGSAFDADYKLSHVIFTNNNIHDVAGSIAFRGKAGDEIETAVVSGNTIDYRDITTGDSQCWATVEVNKVLDLQVYNNEVLGVPEVSWGGEGQAFQFWSIAPWTVDIHDNVIDGCFQGIYFPGLVEGNTCYVPSGTVSYNTFQGNTDFAVGIAPEASGGPLNAKYNWWGHATGPDHSSNPHGTGQGGDAVSDNVDFTPWYATATTTSSTDYVSVEHNPIIALSDTIQGGIDAAVAGDTVNVSAGTYTEYIHITKDNLTVQGAGIDQSIIDLDGLIPYWHYPCSGSFASRAGVLISGYGNPDEVVEGVTFKGFTVKNAGLNPPITATGTHTGADNAAILTDAGASWTPGALVGQWVHNVSDKLIVIDISGNNPIRSYGLITANDNTTVTATLAGGLDNDWDNGDTYEILPYEEYVDVAEDLQDDVRGIAISNGKDVSILYCKVINSGYMGITAGYARCVSTHKYSEGVTIDQCIVSDHPSRGISVGSYPGPIIITNNVCSNNKSPHPTDPSRESIGTGIYVAGKSSSLMASGLIANNTCENNGFIGISLAKYTDGVTIEKNTVAGHNFDEDGAGIFMYDWGDPEYCKNHDVDNNTVTGNIRGIVAYYTSDSIIQNNVITTDSGAFDPGQAAIKLDGSNNITVKDNSISCDGVGISVVYWEGHGSVSSYNNTFTGNTITGAKFAGILISGDVHDNTFTYNTISGTTELTFWEGKSYEETQADGVFIDDDGGTGNVFNYNIIYGNVGDGMENQVIGTIVDAENNWWGDASGPYDGDGTTEVPSCTGDPATEVNSDGTGDEVSDNVDYCPWLGGPDMDGDGLVGEEDNCPYDYNPGQEDEDNEDGVGDICDNCPDTPNGPDLGVCVKVVGSVLMSTEVECEDNGPCEEPAFCDTLQLDLNENGVGDVCECYADFNDNGRIDGGDMFILVAEANASMRNCEPNASSSPPCCYADANDNGRIDGGDMYIMVAEANASKRNCPIVPHCPNVVVVP